MSERERDVRREKLEALRAEGVDPFPSRVDSREPVSVVHERFGALSEEDLEAAGETVAVCGRVLAQRSFGKLVFLTIVENGARIQVSAKKKEIPAEVFARADGTGGPGHPRYGRIREDGEILRCGLAAP